MDEPNPYQSPRTSALRPAPVPDSGGVGPTLIAARYLVLGLVVALVSVIDRL